MLNWTAVFFVGFCASLGWALGSVPIGLTVGFGLVLADTARDNFSQPLSRRRRRW